MPSLYVDPQADFVPATPCEECGGDLLHLPGCSAYKPVELYQPKPPSLADADICPVCLEGISDGGVWANVLDCDGDGATVCRKVKYCSVECMIGDGGY